MDRDRAGYGFRCRGSCHEGGGGHKGENFLLERSWLFIQSQVSALPLCMMAYCVDAEDHLEMNSSGQTAVEVLPRARGVRFAYHAM